MHKVRSLIKGSISQDGALNIWSAIATYGWISSIPIILGCTVHTDVREFLEIASADQILLKPPPVKQRRRLSEAKQNSRFIE